MASQKQIIANQRNALKSKGPVQKKKGDCESKC